MRSFLHTLRLHIAALRLLLLLTVVLGVLYPLAITALAQVPGLKSSADGSLLTHNGSVVGTSLIGQSFTDAKGNPLPQYFQSRPSAAGAGYDPTASSASNLGPESIVDQPDKPSLLTQVCTRSLAVGKEFGVSGARPFCTPDGVGAVLAVFYAGPGYHGAITKVIAVNQTCPAAPFLSRYRTVTVGCAVAGADYSRGEIVPVRGPAPAHPAVPADAVTASGSGLDPDISVAYARLQADSVAAARHTTPAKVTALIQRYTTGRALGFLGEQSVNVLELNIALDRAYPAHR